MKKKNIIMPENNTESKKTYSKNISNIDELYKYINMVRLCREAKCNEKNYLARINYYLKILNYKLFFTETETLDNLEKRLKGPPDNIIIYKKNEKIKLIDIPDNLMPSKETVIIKSPKNKKASYSQYSYVNNYKFSKDEDEYENKENTDEEDGFDMECDYSDFEEENEEIGGYFSD